jgi:hypothetical protein
MAIHYLLGPTVYFFVSHVGGVCKDPTTVLLYLVSFWIPTGCCSLVLGASFIRRRLGLFSEYHGYKFHPQRIFLSFFGSFLLLTVVFNITAAFLLNGSEPVVGDTYLTCIPGDCTEFPYSSWDDVSYRYWAWYIRPLPATFVLALSLLSPPLFLENAIEMQLVEAIVGMFTIKVYSDLNALTPDWTSSLEGFSIVRPAAIVGIVAWSISLVWLLLVLAKPAGALPLVWGAILFNLSRMCVGLAIWSGVAKIDKSTFCPNMATTGFMVALWVIITLADHFWRALFCVGRIEWLWRYLRFYYGVEEDWPLDVTVDIDGLRREIDSRNNNN